MAVIVVRFARPRGQASAPATRSEHVAAASPLVTWTSLIAVVVGVGLVLASMAGGPLWLRIAFIATGMLVAVTGLAELAAETLAEGLSVPVTIGRQRAVGRPARPPA